jgi:two-component system chemotaxis sensor kinase CheA
MHNLRQAVFSIDRNAKVVAPVSRYTDSVFGGSILDQKILSVLFNEGKVKNEIVAKMDFVFNACLGADEAQWVLAEGYLPAELSVRRAGRDKLLKMSYTPLYDRNKLVQNIMIVAEDITEMKALRQAAAQQQAEIAVIKAFLEMGRSEIVPLLDDCSEKVAKSRALFSNLLSAEDATLELSRVLHTLKGNARMYAFHLLAGHIHELEQHLEEWADARKEEDVDGADKLHQQMSSELQTVQKEVKSYYLIASKFLGDGDIVDGAGAPSSVFRGLAPMVERLAKGLEKQIQFIYEIQGIDESLSTLGRERVQSFKDALIHMVRNSVDHGIESAEERVALKKDRLGVISVKVWVASEHELRVTVSDDGRGVDGVGLAAKAVERGMLDPEEAALLSEQERVELMFRPNLSIKETASLISGRGLGMDAVKDSLQRLGGSISVESRAGQGTTFEMSFPVA